MSRIPFSDLRPIHAAIKPAMLEAFENVYDGNRFILGECLERFEHAYARFNAVEECIGVSNGLDALRICLAVLGIGKGDEVLLPANSFIATALAVIHAGARPVFLDPDADTCNLSGPAIEAAITSRTRAIIPVHLYGQSCDMPAIKKIAQKHSLFIIEDNAQAQGARYEDRLTGSWGEINATSFYPGKNLGALGDAGGITTNDAALAKAARILRNYGAEQKYQHREIGFNMRMDECQAAFLSVKLQHLMDWVEKRREIAGWYNEGLRGLDEIVLPYAHPSAYHVYHLFVIRTPRREALQSWLQKEEIETLVHYPRPLHLEDVFSYLGYRPGALPIAEAHAASCCSLPLWVGMQQEDVERICQAIKNFFK